MLGGGGGVQNMLGGGGCTNEVGGCAPPQKIRQCFLFGHLTLRF